MCRTQRAEDLNRERGFTLIEVLVALAVAGMVLAAVGSVFAVTSTGVRSARERVDLAQTGRRLLASLPARTRLSPGFSSGKSGDLTWRLEIDPMKRGVAGGQGGAWVPLTAVLTVRAPSGRQIRLDTVRLVPRMPK